MKNISNVIVMSGGDYKVADFEWGRLTWFVSGELGNSKELTVGKCEIKPGFENPFHTHPNCSEVLHVLSGKIIHRIAGKEEVLMNEGDTISIPANIRHNAKNAGDTTAVLLICFSSAARETKGE